MSKFHSTMSRRDFMKVIGVTGAGIGATAAITPAFNDFDEMISQGVGVKRPWWAKTVETPTTEIDWQNMKKFSEGNTMRGKGTEYMATYIDKAEQDRRAALKAEATKIHKEAKDPGYTARDYAFSGNAGRGLTSNGFENWKTASTPEKLGLPKWEGTPEENAAMVRTFLRFHGMLSVGFTKLETDTTMKLMYEYGPSNKEKYTFADVDEPSYVKGVEQVYPNKCKWVITVANQESQELWKRNPYPLQVQIRYPRAQWIQEQFQGFMTSLGYYALSEGGNGTGIAPAFGVMSGMGEMGRMNRMITPEWGPTVGIFRYVTDLPLPDDKPIDAGFLNFCKSCKKCAEACLEGAHSTETEPTWEVTGPWNNPGHKAWFEDSRKCRAYQSLPDSCNAGTCLAVCTFTKYEKAGIHEVIKSVVSTTSMFNGFFRQMDDIFYHDGLKDPASFWDVRPPIYGVDNVGYEY
ncbi:reductive dehalogenase [Dehalogenimonas sp. THU2]|uniref:reductive dehalogenase n=1 Tax=Dehalogenimonas sp. THU2 TaxID=3151121 RepID=UPI003218CBC7